MLGPGYEATRHLGELYRSNGDIEELIKLSERAAALSPAMPWPWVSLGDAFKSAVMKVLVKNLTFNGI